MSYQGLLNRYLSEDGEVRYGAWQAQPEDVEALDQALAQWCDPGPEQLSDWLNLYNALVIREIVRRWPLESVKDVKPSLLSKLVPLQGFFRDLKFRVGGETMSLGDIENKVIRARFQDARIHFAINCGSASCPILRKDAFDQGLLEEQLQQASEDFVGNPSHVCVSDEAKEVRLSKIFRWYRRDFEAHVGGGLFDFLQLFAKAELAEDLARAQREGYTLRYVGYDWAVNAA